MPALPSHPSFYKAARQGYNGKPIHAATLRLLPTIQW